MFCLATAVTAEFSSSRFVRSISNPSREIGYRGATASSMWSYEMETVCLPIGAVKTIKAVLRSGERPVACLIHFS